MNEAFEYRTTITIGDTNLLRNMYFSNHFKIQGVTRELWMNQCVSNSTTHLSNGLILITKSAQCDYDKDFYLYDEVICKMNIGKLRNASFELLFTFIHGLTGEVHAKGKQEIVFADSFHKICKMPKDFIDAAQKYQA